MCFFIKLGRYVNHSGRMDPIDFGGQRSKVKVTIDRCGNKFVNMIETKKLSASSSNLADMLTMTRESILLILEVKGQGHNGLSQRSINQKNCIMTVYCRIHVRCFMIMPYEISFSQRKSNFVNISLLQA